MAELEIRNLHVNVEDSRTRWADAARALRLDLLEFADSERFDEVAGAAAAVPLASGLFLRRAVDRLLDAPRTAPGEVSLAPALDAMGGEVAVWAEASDTG